MIKLRPNAGMALLFVAGMISGIFMAQDVKAQISDSIDVVHYRIHIDSIGFTQKYLRARAEIWITPADTGNALDGICLQLLGMQVDSVEGPQGPIAGFILADTLLRFGLSIPIIYGDTAHFTVHYSGNPHVEPYNWGGFHFQGSTYAYNLAVAIADIPHNYGKVMYPCVDDFIDRASYEFLVRAPAGMTAVSIGLLHTVTPHPDGSATWHWKLEESIPTYLACIAVSDYVVINDTFPSITGSIPVSIHVRQTDSLKAAQSFVNLVPVCQLFEQYFGPYQWPRVGYVIAPKGAMEHATCITYPRSAVDGTLSSEYLYAHELAHMWFGDLVTCSGAEEMWLNEGWASFAEFIYKEGLYGIPARKNYVRNSLKGILQSAHIEEGGYRALYGMPQEYTYGNTIYEKGACVAHTLRGYLGDSLFFPAIRKYLEHYAFKDATSAQLRDLLEQETGVPLDDFFDAWVYGPGYPHFRIDSFQILPLSMPPSASTEVFISQQGKGTQNPAQTIRAELLFMNDQWQRYTTRVEIAGSSGSAVVEVPFWPTRVFIDPEEMICDATTDAFLTIKSTGRKIFPDTWFEADITAVTDSALIRATHHWVPPDPLQQPVSGFRISNYRYWSIDELGASQIKGKLRFFYTKFSNLDNGIILNPADSVVLLYRKGPGFPWAGIHATMDGQTYQGYMVTDTIMAGDYALGVWDYTFLSISESREKEDMILVYPNPSSDSFTIRCNDPDAAAIRIFSAEGQEVFFHKLNFRQSECTWDATTMPPGMYFLVSEDKNGRGLAYSQLIRK